MKISTKGRYGLHVLLDVAEHENAGPVALSDISRRQSISQKYLWQVVNPLKIAVFEQQPQAVESVTKAAVAIEPPLMLEKHTEHRQRPLVRSAERIQGALAPRWRPISFRHGKPRSM